jgi:hypothetical protein
MKHSIKPVVIILFVLCFGLVERTDISAQVEPFSSPDVLSPPVRTFIIDHTLSAQNGASVAPLIPITPIPDSYACAELGTHQVLLFSPPAESDNAYIQMVLSENGTTSALVAPHSSHAQYDAFLRLPGDPDIICRKMTSADTKQLLVGIATSLEGSYVWEKYQDALKAWALSAATTPSRPPDPPVGEASSLADRLWFLALWIQRSGVIATENREQAADFLRWAAMWEILRIRPLNNLGFALSDISEFISDECVPIPDLDDRTFCKSSQVISQEIEGPAIVHISLRPEIREEPTAILEEAFLSVTRDGSLLYHDPVPFYPDHEPYSLDTWQIPPPPLLSPDGKLLGRKAVVRVLIPPGVHTFTAQLEGQTAWWAISIGRPMAHLEDTADRSESLSLPRAYENESPFNVFLQAEHAYRLGYCDKLDALYEKIFDDSKDTRLRAIVQFRTTSCTPAGELVTPENLAEAFSQLDHPLKASMLPWEDRSGEAFRQNQITAARARYRVQSPDWSLRANALTGNANTALAGAVRQLWFLDGIWQELFPQDADLLEETWLFQERAKYPGIEALPGGLSLLSIHEAPLVSQSRLVDGISRQLLLVSSGAITPSETRLSVDDYHIALLDEAPVQTHSLLTDGPVAISKEDSQPRSVWMQTTLSEREDVAEAKLVRVWSAKESTVVFAPPQGGYDGYALLQLFPPANTEPQNIRATLSDGARKWKISGRYDRAISTYPIADSLDDALVHPLSFPIDLGRVQDPITVSLHTSNQGWHVRLLIRVPRPEDKESISSSDAASIQTSSDFETSLSMLKEITATIANLSALTPDAAAAIYLRRGTLLCELGYAALAREDLQRAALSLSDEEQLQANLLALSEMIETGACRTLPKEPLKFAIPIGATVVSESLDDTTETNLRAYLRARLNNDTPTALHLCEELVQGDYSHLGCLPWWASIAGQKLLDGHPLTSDSMPMLVALSAMAERTNWAGLDYWLPLFNRLTLWQPIGSVDHSAGTRAVQSENESSIDINTPDYLRIATALAHRPQDSSFTRPLFPGSTLAVSLPTQTELSGEVNIRCALLTPSSTTESGLCRFELKVDGSKIGYTELIDGEAKTVNFRISEAGSHLIEVAHLPGSEQSNPVAMISIGVSTLLQGIPSQKTGSFFILGDRTRQNLWVATYNRPISFHILGPAILKIVSQTTTGDPTESLIQVLDETGAPIPAQMSEQAGRWDIWLEYAGPAIVTIRPQPDGQTILARAFYRDISTRTLLNAQEAQRPGSTRSTNDHPTRDLLLDDSYLPDNKSKLGTLSLMLGFRRKPRDETERITPFDQYFLSNLSYSRRIEPTELWLSTGVEGRYRLDGAHSVDVTGSLMWVSPEPAQVTIAIRDSVAVQNVQTGLAAGNMVSLDLSRRFDLSPTVSLVPALAGYYKWQALNDWRENLIPEYIDSSVYNAYLRDHPWSVILSLLLSWQPVINANLFALTETAANSDFKMIDYVRFRAGTRMAFERLQVLAFYDLQPRFADSYRDAFYLRHQIHGGLQYSFWPNAVLRIAPTAHYDFYPHNMGHGIFGGLTIELSPERGLRDHAAGDEIFPWQIDPQREWVRQW